MSSNFLPVLGREDINPRRMPVRLFNQRFIDPDGNIYKINFDFRTREARVVQVVKTRLEALRLRAKMKTVAMARPAAIQTANQSADVEIVKPVINQNLAADLLADVLKIGPRIAGIIAVLKECSQHSGEQGKLLLQIMRDADLNCVARAQTAIRLVRSNDTRPGDTVIRMDDRWLQNADICRELSDNYDAICEALTKIQAFHAELIHARDRIWTRAQKRSLDDAEHTLQTLTAGATRIATDLRIWKNQLNEGVYALPNA